MVIFALSAIVDHCPIVEQDNSGDKWLALTGNRIAFEAYYGHYLLIKRIKALNYGASRGD